MPDLPVLLADDVHTFLETGGSTMEWSANHTVGVLVFPWDDSWGWVLNMMALCIAGGILAARVLLWKWD